MNKIQKDFQVKLIEDITKTIENNLNSFSSVSPENKGIFGITVVHTLLYIALIDASIIDKVSDFEAEYTYKNIFESIKNSEIFKEAINAVYNSSNVIN